MLEIAQKLDLLASLYTQKDNLDLEKQEVMNTIIPPEIRKRLEEIDDEYKNKFDAINSRIADTEVEIKNDTLKFGDSVKASGFLSIWNKGRITWDNSGLSNFATSHPEILEFRKEGDPFNVIRREQSKTQSSGA